MSCNACLCVVGENYSISGGYCYICGNYPAHSYTGTYIGKSNNKHHFRIHNEKCSVCGVRITKGIILCECPDGIDVTEEFRLLVYR